MKKITVALIALVALFLIITGNNAKDTVQTLQINGDTISQQAKEPVRITHNPKAAEFTLYRDNDVIDTYSEKFPITAGEASLRAEVEKVNTIYLLVGETAPVPTTNRYAETLRTVTGDDGIVTLQGYYNIVGKKVGKATILACYKKYGVPVEEKFEVMVVDSNIKAIDEAAVRTLEPTNIWIEHVTYMTLRSEIYSEAFTEYGFCYSDRPNSTIKNNPVKAGLDENGSFARIAFYYEGPFYFCAYAKTKSGAVVYGNEIRYDLYDVVTLPVEKTKSGVTLTGSFRNISSQLNGGFVYSQSPNPAKFGGIVFDNVETQKENREKLQVSHYFSWSDLLDGTTYNVQAFAINRDGEVFYGQEIQFTAAQKDIIAYASHYPEVPQTSGSAWTVSAKGHIQPVKVTEPIVLYNCEGYNSVNLDAKLFAVESTSALPVGQGDIVWSSTDPNVEIRGIEGAPDANVNVTINKNAFQGNEESKNFTVTASLKKEPAVKKDVVLKVIRLNFEGKMFDPTGHEVYAGKAEVSDDFKFNSNQQTWSKQYRIQTTSTLPNYTLQVETSGEWKIRQQKEGEKGDWKPVEHNDWDKHINVAINGHNLTVTATFSDADLWNRNSDYPNDFMAVLMNVRVKVKEMPELSQEFNVIFSNNRNVNDVTSNKLNPEYNKDKANLWADIATIAAGLGAGLCYVFCEEAGAGIGIGIGGGAGAGGGGAGAGGAGGGGAGGGDGGNGGDGGDGGDDGNGGGNGKPNGDGGITAEQLLNRALEYASNEGKAAAFQLLLKMTPTLIMGALPLGSLAMALLMQIIDGLPKDEPDPDECPPLTPVMEKALNALQTLMDDWDNVTKVLDEYDAAMIKANDAFDEAKRIFMTCPKATDKQYSEWEKAYRTELDKLKLPSDLLDDIRYGSALMEIFNQLELGDESNSGSIESIDYTKLGSLADSASAKMTTQQGKVSAAITTLANFIPNLIVAADGQLIYCGKR
ncbi:hypothetical protein FACS1894162_2890 [Bacteroidia bacterium]|nr:hypothetical protein FACS1894162_2890 [Bacteroidia bacterium]